MVMGIISKKCSVFLTSVVFFHSKRFIYVFFLAYDYKKRCFLNNIIMFFAVLRWIFCQLCSLMFDQSLQLNLIKKDV